MFVEIKNFLPPTFSIKLRKLDPVAFTKIHFANSKTDNTKITFHLENLIEEDFG